MSASRPAVWREWSAEHTVNARQAGVALALVALVGLGVAWYPTAIATALIACCTAVFVATAVCRALYFFAGLARPPQPSPATMPCLDRQPCPRYSVVVALYREADVVPALFDSMAQLDYPHERLQFLIVVEADDLPTIEACNAHLREGWELVRAPDGGPRTKPRALNVALPRIEGELFTIYDAEDRPDSDQLQKAVAEFDRLPGSVAALQARLDFYNSRQNLLTRWFACDYATNFGLYLEGIARLGHAMPLGGTSTHFRTAAVRAVGGWDAFNVTEDCELGMRLAAAGYVSRTLHSTTWEEAVPRLGGWIRQRSRWIKGFAQTALAMLRAPVRSARAMGPGRYVAALVWVGGVPVLFAVQLWFWIGLWAYAAMSLAGADVAGVDALFAEPLLTLSLASLLVGNFIVLLASVAAVYQQGRFDLVRYALVLPLYWLLASVAAWKALWQLVARPHYWEKTQHGLAEDESAQALAPGWTTETPQLEHVAP
jgi:cellulose synthase/poly-beta-1,6-N-acetylglucosamine synthase-like glycosyltransferase